MVAAAVLSQLNREACPAAFAPIRTATAAGRRARRPARRPSRPGSWPVDQQPGLLVEHGVAQAADVGGDHRATAGLGLQRDQAERLVVARGRRRRRRRSTSGTAPSAASAAGSRPGRRRRARRPAARSVWDQSESGPLGLPMMISRSRSRRRGSRRASSATARISTSGALSGWIRPTNRITWASWATPSWARDFGWSQGWKVCRSTPGGTIVIWPGLAP